MLQRGRNHGVTGIFDISGAPQFTGEALFFRRVESSAPVERTGPTDRRAVYAQSTIDGMLVISGRVRADGYPMPNSLNGATGTATLQFHSSRTETVGVVVVQSQISHNEPESDIWSIDLVCKVTSSTWAWGGSQADTDDDPAYDPKETTVGGGRTKTGDPNEIHASATARFHVVGINGGDDDVEWQEILNRIAASVTTPFPNAKLRLVSLVRLDYWSALVSTEWGYRDTIDDLVLPRSTAVTDDYGLVDEASTAAVNATAPAPADTTLFEYVRRSEKIHDNATLETAQWRRRTSKDEHELGSTATQQDPDDIGETASIGQVTGSATPPSPPAAPVGQHIRTVTQPLTRPNGAYTGYWLHRFDYGPTTGKQQIEFSDAAIEDDQSNLSDRDTQRQVTASSTPPAPPSPRIADLKLVRITSVRAQGMPERWVHTWSWARNTAEDELEHTRRNIDLDNFDEAERIPVLHNSGTVAPVQPTPDGDANNVVDIAIERLVVPSGAFSGLWLWTYTFGHTTRKQAIEQEGVLDDDQSDLDDQDVQTLTNSSQTPPSFTARISGQTLVRIRSVRLQNTPQKWKHTAYFAWLSNRERIEHAGTQADADSAGTRAISGRHSIQTIVQDCLSGDTASSLLATYVSGTLNADTTTPWLRADAVKLTKTRAQIRVWRPTDDKRVIRGAVRAGFEKRELDATGTYVKVAWAQASGTGQKAYVLQYWDLYVQRQSLVLRRYYRVNAISTTFFDSMIGTRNNATFLGEPAFTVAFMGASLPHNWNEEGTDHWVPVDLSFEVCKIRDALGNVVGGHWEASVIPIGTVLVTTQNLNPGDTPAASSLASQWVATTLTNADYGVFLT